jgi:hypothetical protein
VVSDTARSAAIGTNVMMGNIGGLISTWSFLPFDGPDYHIGNGLNLATSSTILVCSITLLLWMWADNKRREKKDVNAELDGLSVKQVQNLDWRHPGKFPCYQKVGFVLWVPILFANHPKFEALISNLLLNDSANLPGTIAFRWRP